MKKSLVAALVSVALLSGTGATAHATTYRIGFGFSVSFSASPSCPSGGCSGPGCCVIPGWSGCYPPPVAWGGYYASNPYQAAYTPNYGVPNYGGSVVGYDQVPPSTKPVPLPTPAPKSVVPSPKSGELLPNPIK